MTLTPTTVQPLRAAVGAAREALTEVSDAQAIYLSTGEKEALLVDLARLEAQVAGLKLRAMAAAGDVAEAHGQRDVTGWLAKTVRLDPIRLRADERLAGALDERYTATGAALASGEVNLEQARVIATAVDALPARVGVEVKARAEADLIGFAADHAPADLRRLGSAILHVSCPEIADEEDSRRLEEAERNALEKTSTRFRPVGDGTTRVTSVLPDLDAARLVTYLDAHANPRVTNGDSDASDGDVERLPQHRRRGQAFLRLLDHLDPAVLPRQGGDATTVVVTMTLDQLQTGLGAAQLTTPLATDGSVEVSAAHARRLACTAGIIPAVLGGKSEVLDLGRTQRLHTPAIRRALRINHKTCTAEGCTIPAAWCDAHHLTPWAHGGETNLKDATLLCGFHHHRIHDPAYEHRQTPDGIRFHRRT